MCSNAINKALLKIPFIQSVKSDIKNSSFAILFKENAAIDIDVIKDAVEDAGFSVGSLKLTGDFHDLKVEKDKHVKIGQENFHFLVAANRVLDGEQTITVVDRSFLTEKQFKKISTASSMECVRTGKTSSCCEKDGLHTGERIYHVTI
jgi:copper chaperone CopZ